MKQNMLNLAVIVRLVFFSFLSCGHIISHGHEVPNYQAECGKLENGDQEVLAKRIVGGHEARAWPWMGALFYIVPNSYPRRGFPICGCTLISPRWVITAAHCVINKMTEGSIDFFNDLVQEDLVEIMFGQTSLDNAKGSTHKLKRGYIMPGYRRGSDYDVALLELLYPVEISERIHPVCLDLQGKFDCTPESCPSNCIAVGWGSEKDATGPVNKILYEVTRPMIPNQNCLKEWSYVSPRMQCYGADEEGKGVCSGDSGGPILCQEDGVWYQAAVISRTIVMLNHAMTALECGEENSLDLHVRVSNEEISSWIKETTGIGSGGLKREMTFSFDT